MALFAIAEVIMKFTLFIPGAIFTTTTGDATSGFLVVITEAQGWDPTLGHTMMTNYPFGDDIAKPAYITWIAILGPLWLLSRVMRPTTALALVTVLGYVSSGLGMYGLVKRLSGHWYVAVFAAYAAAFMPYHVYKSSDHLTNVFNVVVIMVIGFFLAVWRRATKARILGLGVSVALACYTDGYYIMIGGFTVLGLVIAALLSDRFIGDVPWRQIGRRILHVAIAGLVAALLMAPIGIAYVAQSREILGDLGQQRGSILQDALSFSAQPMDFVLPPEQNPIVTHIPVLKAISDMRELHSNIAERANYLGWTVILLVLIGYGGLVVARRRGRTRVVARETAERVALLALPLVFVWALGPQLVLGDRGIPLPYLWLTQISALWRVPARMVLAVQPLAVLAATSVLSRLLARVPPPASRGSGFRRRAAALPVVVSIVLTVVLSFEYWTPTTARPFSARDMPQTYTWIKQQGDIKAILELPIGGYATTSAYYAYAQLLHGRATVNSTLGSPDEGLFDAVIGPQNMEAINLARLRGVDTVVVHGETCLNYPWGRLVHSESNALTPDSERGSVCVYRLNPATITTDDMFPSVTGDALSPWILSHPNGELGVKVWIARVVVAVVDSAGNPYSPDQRATLRSTIRTVDEAARSVQWTATQGDKVVASGQVYSADFEVDAGIVTGSPVTLSFLGADGQPVASNQLETMGFEIDPLN